MLTVLLVSEPGIDGVFRYVEGLAHFLMEQGVRVHLAYSDRRGSAALYQLVGHVRQQGGETLNLATGNAPQPADVRAWFALLALVRRTRPDIIHSHSSKAGALARSLALLGIRIPQVYHAHAYAGMRVQSRAARLLYDGIERMLGHLSLTINCSHDEQDYARGRLRLPAVRTRCIPNSVDTQRFTPPVNGQKADLRELFDLPARALILGSLGRASAQKDPLTLYRAFALARETEPDLVLFHLGRGELDAELDRFVREHDLQAHIIRRDYLATPVDFYRCVDGFILTSRYEGLSLGALEAMSCDLPLILSEAPGNDGLIKLPLSHRWSAPAGDVAGFARAIRDWAARCRAGATPSNHRTTALTRFDLRTNLTNVLTVYRQLAVRLRDAAPPLPAETPSAGRAVENTR
jgi:glycosyltransferase involved in cell wall biosynthesis